jgi:uncharacterized membrane protein YfcA
MVFGSLVGGGTSEGGGAIAFPIFTKLLHIAPRDARNFSLAIQSIGMGAATVSILYLRIPIERRAWLYAGVPGILGVALGAVFVAPRIPPIFVRTSFTVLVSSMAVALLLVNREKDVLRNRAMPIFGPREKMILVLAGLLGGVVSALVAAVPIAVVAAPLGALICSQMKRHSIVHLLLFLIALEFISTIVLVPLPPPVLWVSLATLIICGSIDFAMSRARRYLPENIPSS